AHNMLDGAVGGVIVVKVFAHDPWQAIAVIVRKSYTPVHGGGTQIDQKTVGLKNAVCFAEGIDHALVRHSSQGPGKDDRVEGFVRMVEFFGLARPETDPLF